MYEKDELVYVGHTGTGFDQRTLEVVRERRKHFAPVLGRGLPDFGLQRRAS